MKLLKQQMQNKKTTKQLPLKDHHTYQLLIKQANKKYSTQSPKIAVYDMQQLLCYAYPIAVFNFFYLLDHTM